MVACRAARGAPQSVTTAVEHALTVERVVAGGDGLARDDGLAVFIPRTLPGEQVRASIRMRGRLARGELIAIDTPSPARVQPRCGHYTDDDCGGCQLQHADYAQQLRIKAELVVEAFRRIARRAVDTPRVHAAPHPWRYRRKLTLALRRDDAGWYAGLRPHHDPAAVFRLQDCLITCEQVVETWREVLRAARYLPEANVLRGSVQIADDGGLVLHIEGGRTWPAVGDLHAAVPELHTVLWTPEHGHRQLVASRGNAATPAGFMQVNAEVAATLLDHVVSAIEAHEPRVVVDAYAGEGAAAVRLAGRGVRVTAIEVDRDAARIAEQRVAPPSSVVCARVERALAGALPADVVLLNPPRGGLHHDVCRVLAASLATTRAVIYVSCDPATLARDVSRLDGWHLARLECFDMFPQTSHVETVCELLPAAA